MRIKIIAFIAVICLASYACPGFAEVLGNSRWAESDTYARESLRTIVKATVPERFKDNKNGCNLFCHRAYVDERGRRDLQLNLKAVTWYEAAKKAGIIRDKSLLIDMRYSLGK